MVAGRAQIRQICGYQSVTVSRQTAALAEARSASRQRPFTLPLTGNHTIQNAGYPPTRRA
jgi:hypothetical protein